MSEKPQNFENHAKIVPAFHMVAFPIFAINFFWCTYRMVRAFSAQTAVSFLLAVGLMLLLFLTRIFALQVQDRVIRLEMRLRLREILPEDLRPRIPELALSQLVSLRFASDRELPELTRRVLAEKLTDRKAIKKMIRDWQPDSLRA